MSMIWKSAMLLARHGSCSLMDRLVMMVKGLVLFLFLRVALFLNSQTYWKRNTRIIKVEYEALLFGLEFLESMGIKYVEAYGDSLLVVQQVSKVYLCYNGSLNAYLDRCLDIMSCFDEFVIRHIPREDNGNTNTLSASI